MPLSRSPSRPHRRTMRRAWLLCGLLAITAWLTATAAVAADIGLPSVHTFSAADYGAAQQNWAITQGPDGVIYVGNVDDGVLTFDGARWQRIPMPNQLVVRSLATGTDGRIYVGLVGDFGYLAPDRAGQLAFVSLRDRVPAADREFADVWTIHVIGAEVYFATLTAIYHLHAGTLRVIRPQTGFHLSFAVNGTLYVREVERGLMRLVNDRLVPMPGGERFADERIYALLPWRGAGARPGDLLIGTRSQGWYIDRGGELTPWHTSADALLDAAAIYAAQWLDDGRLAVATLRGGLFVFDRDGHLLQHLARSSGLGTDVVLALCQDREHGLWLATGNGVSRVNVESPLTALGERSGLVGAVLTLARHAGALYAGTTEGLFRLTDGADGNGRFERVPQAVGQNWSLLPMDGQLLVAGNEGVFAIDPHGAVHKLLVTPRPNHVESAQSLLRSRTDPARVFVAYQDGVGTMHWNGRTWVDEGRIPAATREARTLAQDADGTLWLGLWAGGVGHLRLPADWRGAADPRPVAFDLYTAHDGLPEGAQSVATIDGNVRFLTSRGIYAFTPATHRFAPDPAFARLFPDGPRDITALRQARDGTLWMYTSREAVKETGRARRVNGHWQWQVTPLQPLAGLGMLAFLDEADGSTWIGGDDGLHHVAPRPGSAPAPRFDVLIRQVSTHDNAPLIAAEASGAVPEVAYAHNALRFEYAATTFGHIGTTQFQVMLDGVDPRWSPWSRDAYRDYTNLHEGAYRFRVRARNLYGAQGNEATFAFRILPPWYRTPWAWLGWIAMAALTVAIMLRWREAALRRRNRRLTALVEQRTAELQAANAALAEQSVTDPLTGLKNRRYVRAHITRTADTAGAPPPAGHERRGVPTHPRAVVLMLDLDHFKRVNDNHGHAAGDQVLRQLADILRAATRDTDIVARWGGEEFLIVAHDGGEAAGRQLAERIRATVARHAFTLTTGAQLTCTCSIGFATCPVPDDAGATQRWEQAVNLADECLYEAKRRGRNAWVGVALTQWPATADPLAALRARFADPDEAGDEAGDEVLRLLVSHRAELAQA